MSWRNTAGTVSIDAIVIDYPGGDAAGAAAEFQDWPGVGRSMAASFGESSARTLGKQYGVRCSYEGVPRRRDPSRMVMEMSVEVTCPTSPSPLIVRSALINVLARAEEVLVRVDAYPIANALQDSVAGEIWSTLSVDAHNRLATSLASQETAGRVRPVRGGPGLR